MERIVGLDLSPASTGVGVITRRTRGDCLASCSTVKSTGKRAASLPDRARRIERLADDILHAAASPSLAIVESPAYGARGGSIMDRHFLWWRVVRGLVSHSVPVATCAPKCRSKFATGDGDADKAAVSVAAARLWGELEITNSDEGDAVILAHIGAVYLDWPVVILQRHRDGLAAIAWPELPAAPAVA